MNINILQMSGLSKFIGERLTVLAALPGWFITLLIALFVSVLTEITSNAAVVTVVTPIIIAMVSIDFIGNEAVITITEEMNDVDDKTFYITLVDNHDAVCNLQPV